MNSFRSSPKKKRLCMSIIFMVNIEKCTPREARLTTGFGKTSIRKKITCYCRVRNFMQLSFTCNLHEFLQSILKYCLLCWENWNLHIVTYSLSKYSIKYGKNILFFPNTMHYFPNNVAQMDRGLELSSCIYLQVKSSNPTEPIIILILSIQQKPHIFFKYFTILQF